MPMFPTDFALHQQQQQQQSFQQAFAHGQHHGLGGGQELQVQSGNGGNMSFALGGHSQAQPQVFAQSHGGGQGLGMNNRDVSAEALQMMSVLSSIQQKIGQLQATVPLFNQNQHFSDPIVQQKAAATIAQLAQVAANMFPFGTQPHHQQQQPPSFNLFPQSQAGGGGPPTLPMGGNGSSFPDLPALEGAVNSGMGISGGPLGDDRLADLDMDFQGPNPASLAGQSFGGGQDGNDGSGGTDHVQAAAMGMIGGEVSHLTSSHVRSNQCSGDLQEGKGEAMGLRGEEDDEGGEDEGDDMLPPGSYDLVEMVVEEILAEHTHFCEICSKGFKRDANLRMHMRGHGDQYKSSVALRAPDKGSIKAAAIPRPAPRRYSCPYTGCKRNRKHHKFLPLKSILCVKNHYRRIHCPKILVCRKCNKKKFSVVADLKTHEKHCGCDKWECSCGTTFSRKDKLLGHVSLFVGHTPASFKPSNDGEGTSVTLATPETAHEGTGMGLAGSLHGAAGLGGDGNMVGSENGGSSMLRGLFSSTSGVNASSDGLL